MRIDFDLLDPLSDRALAEALRGLLRTWSALSGGERSEVLSQIRSLPIFSALFKRRGNADV